MEKNVIVRKCRMGSMENVFGNYVHRDCFVRGYECCYYGSPFDDPDDYYYGRKCETSDEDYYNEMQQYYDEVVCLGGEQ